VSWPETGVSVGAPLSKVHISHHLLSIVLVALAYSGYAAPCFGQ